MPWGEAADAKGQQSSCGRKQAIALAPGGAALRIHHNLHAIAVADLLDLLDYVRRPRVEGVVQPAGVQKRMLGSRGQANSFCAP